MQAFLRFWGWGWNLFRLVFVLAVASAGAPCFAQTWNSDAMPLGAYADRAVGEEGLVSPGEVMVSYKDGRIVGGARSEEELSLMIGKKLVTIPAGAVMSRTDSSTPFKACLITEDDVIGCALDDDGDGRFDRLASHGGAKAHPLPESVAYEQVAEVRRPIYPPSVGRVLIYQGSDGKTIKIGYREFINGMARDPFSEELLIPIGDSFPTQVAAKGFIFSIREITGLGLRFAIDKLP